VQVAGGISQAFAQSGQEGESFKQLLVFSHWLTLAQRRMLYILNYARHDCNGV